MAKTICEQWQSAASDLGMHCLPITLLRVSRLKWVKLCITTKIPPGRQHSFEEIDHETFSTVIHSLQLIQE